MQHANTVRAPPSPHTAGYNYPSDLCPHSRYPGSCDVIAYDQQETCCVERAALPYDPADLQKLMVPGVFIQVGIDIAGPGDDETVATARIGQFCIGQRKLAQRLEGMLVAGVWVY